MEAIQNMCVLQWSYMLNVICSIKMHTITTPLIKMRTLNSKLNWQMPFLLLSIKCLAAPTSFWLLLNALLANCRAQFIQHSGKLGRATKHLICGSNVIERCSNCVEIVLACVASVSVAQRAKNGDFGFLLAQKMGREQNRKERGGGGKEQYCCHFSPSHCTDMILSGLSKDEPNISKNFWRFPIKCLKYLLRQFLRYVLMKLTSSLLPVFYL